MPSFLYIYLRILVSFGALAFPIILLQFGVLIRTIRQIINYRRLKAENKADKRETAGVILYSILTAMLWLPLLMLFLLADIKSGNDRYFSIIKNWYIDGGFIIQGIMLAILSAITAFRSSKLHNGIYKISFCIYALCEIILTYSRPKLALESFLTTLGGILLSVSIGYLIGTIIYKKCKA